MKAAIVYATKYGCTKKCAEMLKTYLNGEADILSAKSDKISLAQYDTVFIGGSVYGQNTKGNYPFLQTQFEAFITQKDRSICVLLYSKGYRRLF